MASPKMSSWSWPDAPLPIRTGREPRQPSQWSRVSSVRSEDPSTRYMIRSGQSPLLPLCSTSRSRTQTPKAAASST